ncbi:MAG TPA: GNAT family N-acetyltransferase [Tahibacter sp.]|nr:GNAT family N-acetyltransferase [Tahibacter sp.]
MPTLSPPAPLDSRHRLDGFSCTIEELEHWLKQRARKNHLEGATRCFVVCSDDAVVGYYALAAGSVSRAAAPGGIRRNMPEPIPAIVLGRLAVHRDWSGRGIGAGLLKDAVLRTLRVSQELGIRVMLCHAVDENARRFYLRHGFVESPGEPLTVMLNLAGTLELVRQSAR